MKPLNDGAEQTNRMWASEKTRRRVGDQKKKPESNDEGVGSEAGVCVCVCLCECPDSN